MSPKDITAIKGGGPKRKIKIQFRYHEKAAAAPDLRRRL